MPLTSLLNRFMEPLLAGQREDCRNVMQLALTHAEHPHDVYHNLLWPAMERVDQLYREDRINMATEHLATRINRTLADQLQTHLTKKEGNGKHILIMCADGENEELGAQMCADLFESDGWVVYFVGGGVPNDEILSMVGQLRLDVLLVFGTRPRGVPQVRQLIDLIRDVGVNPTMNIMISGGVFNRADGLWEEINADLFAPTARESLEVANAADPKIPEIRIPGAPKKRRRRRRPQLLMMAEGGEA